MNRKLGLGLQKEDLLNMQKDEASAIIGAHFEEHENIKYKKK